MAYKLTKYAPLTEAMRVGLASEFSRQIHEIFIQRRPTRIIETGTYLGTGTTAVIASALQNVAIGDGEFFTVEVNPAHFITAIQNVRQLSVKVQVMLGLSIPRRLLLSREQINQQYVQRVVDDIYVDFSDDERVEKYYLETDFAGVPDDLLGHLLAHFEYKPHFVLLDSAGHLGCIEFQYVVGKLQGPCVLALDDTRHVKHFDSVLKIKADPRFKVLAESDEKFGFCIAEFNP